MALQESVMSKFSASVKIDRKTLLTEKVMAVFEKNLISEPEGLVGINFETIKEGYGEMIPGGVGNIVQKCLWEENPGAIGEPAQSGRPTPGQPSHLKMSANEIREMFQAAFGKKEEEEEVTQHVDLAAKMGSLTLNDLPSSCWPPPDAVDELAKKIRAKISKGFKNVFILADLSQFMPSYCHSPHGQGDSEDDPHPSGPKQKGALLQFSEWTVAFDKYALAAQATGQMSLAAAYAHKEVCLGVAFRAHIDGRTHKLGVVYDEVARRSWAQRASSEEAGFLVNRAAGQLDLTLLHLAQNEFDAGAKGKQPARYNAAGNIKCYTCGLLGHRAVDCIAPKIAASKGNPKGGGKGIVCYLCGEPGHKKPDCPQSQQQQRGVKRNAADLAGP